MKNEEWRNRNSAPHFTLKINLMAKKIKSDATEELVPTQEHNIEEQYNETTPVLEEHEAVTEDTPSSDKTKDTEPIEMPLKVEEFLKRHPEIESAYIDSLGGVFDEDTPEIFRKGAVLYHNPYFK